MIEKYYRTEDQMTDRVLNERISALEIELKQLKRARNARRGKTRARYPIRQYLSYM